MELSGFYKVSVKVETETEDKNGNIKTKKTKEVYIVDNCGDPQAAVKIVEKAMENCPYEWAVESVKEEKINAVLHHSNLRPLNE
ncbi:MAG: DUF4494 family protein [Paludibacteraceae bacterium]|nr:DUF4494 family protein [Paludibacteraceae bacterium]